MNRSRIILTMTAAIWAGATASTQHARPTSADVLREQRIFMLQARGGRSDVEPSAMLGRVQEALAADPDNSELHRALGDVVLLQTTLAPPAGNAPDVVAISRTIQRALSAYTRAVELDSTNAAALSSRGLTLVFSSLFTQNPALLTEALAALNRAVDLAPDSIVPRLNRAFTGVNLPPPIRDTSKTIEDLKRLIAVAEGSRPGDMVHLLLGDLYAELERTDDARAEYQAAARRPASAAREPAAARLAALDAGTLPRAEIAAMRGSLASNCAMCHGR
jgi:tetratricopeptide (TPR) repeat protein